MTPDRFAIALQWSVVFNLFFWLTCIAVFLSEGHLFGVSHEQREWNAYNDAKRRRILTVALRNSVIITPMWLLMCSALLPSVRALWMPAIPLLVQFVLFFVLTDWNFFLMHWLAHRPLLYRHVHKQHHEITKAFAPGALYCHWLEMWFVNLWQGTLPIVLLGCSDNFILAIMALAAIKTTLAHSKHSAYHFVHHIMPNTTFDGSSGLMDRLWRFSVNDKRRRDRIELEWTRRRSDWSVHVN